MFRHDYIAVNLGSVAAPHPLQGGLENVPAFVGGQQRRATAKQLRSRTQRKNHRNWHSEDSPRHEDRQQDHHAD
jgi:hypothetical protein